MFSRVKPFLWCGVTVAALAAGSAAAANPGALKVGEERPYSLSSPEAYPVGQPHRDVTWSETVHSPGATFLRVHFDKFNLSTGDYLTVSSPDGKDFWTYSDRGLLGTGEFWSFVVEGDTAVLELHSGPATADADSYGFVVDRIAHGTVDISEPLSFDDAPQPEIICGNDGRKNAACYTFNTKPVARLSFQKGGASYLCTGWLVAGPTASTLITNNHCFANQTETNTVQARFNYQYTTCTGTTLASYSSYSGGTFRKTHAGLDYTIITLNGNPEATWGEYTATNKNLTVNTLIQFPQHPGGQPKKVGYYEDAAGTIRCKLATVNATYGSSTAGSQIGYGCDSEGGSSGSPIIESSTGHAIGLHHYGGVSSSPCLNSATQMKQICADAGTALLTCVATSPLTGYITRVGTWNPPQVVYANVSGGVPPYTYAWWRKPVCSSPPPPDPCVAPTRDRSGDAAAVPPCAAPLPDDVTCTEWHGPTYTSPPNQWTPYQGPNQNIRVDVTDAQGTNLTIYDMLD